ncbi:MAG: ABC transporter permease [Armatimonadota bacterium]
MERASFFSDPMGSAPVFVREFRSRMRHPWAFWLLFGYLALLAPASLYFFYRFYHTADLPQAIDATAATGQLQQVGVIFAFSLFAVQLLLVSLLAPVLSCGSFAGERTRRRLVFLWMSPLPSRKIVLGKLQFILLYLVLLLLSTMPLCAISSMFGGISPLDLLAGYALLVAYAYMTGAYGLYVSVKSPRTGRAALWGYLGMLAVYLLFPWLLLPYVGLFDLVVLGDPLLLTQITRELPIPAIAIPLAIVFSGIAEWFISETTAVLDYERHQWGTYAPPLPLNRRHTATTTAVSPSPTQPAIPKRRW